MIDEVQMKVLAIESSCDETGVAVYSDTEGLVVNKLYTQIALHREYGGVVPELASRDHIRKAIPLVREAMDSAGLTPKDIDAVAYTAGPGLIGALLVGAAVGRSLAFAWGCPAVPVHHMEGHLLAPMLEEKKPHYPFLALLVSGGHTMIVKVARPGSYKVMGQSIDDAAGEAFDKTAKLLGIPYPGGPGVSALAEKGHRGKYVFPRPMTDRPGYDFSFSGLKTAAATAVEQVEGELTDEIKADIAFGFEDAVIDTLITKVSRALKAEHLKELVVAGGVSANRHLRARIGDYMKKIGGEVFYPRPEFCTDNGAMIACAGMLRLKLGQVAGDAIEVRPRWALEDISVDRDE